MTILEGESLVNDATALILYRAALAAIAGTFSMLGAGAEFVVVARRRDRDRRRGRPRAELGLARISDPTLELVISLLVPFAAYLPAAAVDASGVLAVVTAGIIAGRRGAGSCRRTPG